MIIDEKERKLFLFLNLFSSVYQIKENFLYENLRVLSEETFDDFLFYGILFIILKVNLKFKNFIFYRNHIKFKVINFHS